MPRRHGILAFRPGSALPKPAPAKAALRDDVAASVARSIDKLPVLARANPEAALLIERCITDWMPRHLREAGVDPTRRSGPL